MPDNSSRWLHALLQRNDAGEVTIHWWRLIVMSAAIVGGVLIGALALSYFAGAPFRIGRVAMMSLWILLSHLVFVFVAKRYAEGRSLRQFSLLNLFVVVSIACILLALITADRRRDLARNVARERLESSIKQIVGIGNVQFSGSTTLIQVKRPSFNDDDLQKLLGLNEKLQQLGAPIYLLDLSGTSVTDRSVVGLKHIHSLEYCFLLQTSVTDASIDALRVLPKLKVLGVNSTAVTTERLLQLSIERPELNIEPKAYQKLKAK
jgi:hypothetical protein